MLFFSFIFLLEEMEKFSNSTSCFVIFGRFDDEKIIAQKTEKFIEDILFCNKKLVGNVNIITHQSGVVHGINTATELMKNSERGINEATESIKKSKNNIKAAEELMKSSKHYINKAIEFMENSENDIITATELIDDAEENMNDAIHLMTTARTDINGAKELMKNSKYKWMPKNFIGMLKQVSLVRFTSDDIRIILIEFIYSNFIFSFRSTK